MDDAPEFLFSGSGSGSGSGRFHSDDKKQLLHHNSSTTTTTTTANTVDHFAVEELLDFSCKDQEVDDDQFIMTTTSDAFFDNGINSNDSSSTVIALDSCNVSSASASASCGTEPQLSAHSSSSSSYLISSCVLPYVEDMAEELEWLSNFVEDSFSTGHHHPLLLQPLIPATKLLPPTSFPAGSSAGPTVHQYFHPAVFTTELVISSVPGKARSKRSRAAPCDWSSRLLLVSCPAKLRNHRPAAVSWSKKKRELGGGDTAAGPGRKCLHCASEKTPQWRTGPMGPKTLCNACGVRYKSGRLVAEYRPAASPTFVSTKHSNSHRKVLDLRRQNEMQRSLIGSSQSSIFGLSNNIASSSSEYLCTSWSS